MTQSLVSKDGRKLRHSRVSKILVLVSGIVLFLFLALSLFMDKTVNIRVTQSISTHPEKILPFIANLQSWQEWTVWDSEYYQSISSFPTYQTNSEGEVVRSVEKQVVNDSSQMITIERKEKSEKRVVYGYSFWDGENNSTPPLIQADTIFTLVREEQSTSVTWEYQADYSSVMGANPLQKYFLFFTEVTLKRAYRESLTTLKEKLEN